MSAKNLQAGTVVSTEILIDGIRQSGVENWRVNYSGGCHVGSINHGHYVEHFPCGHWVELELRGEMTQQWESPKYVKASESITQKSADLTVEVSIKDLIGESLLDAFSHADLLKLRDDVNAAIYDREKQGLME
jgi:hypothetical protein